MSTDPKRWVAGHVSTLPRSGIRDFFELVAKMKGQDVISLGVGEPAVVQEAVAARKRGAAQEALLGLLRRPEGATVAEMQGATGWQPHSVRGALSGLISKKLGHEVASTKEERGRVYRIAG